MKTQNLNYCAIDIKPINRDWSIGYGETWEFHAACRCEECGEVLTRGGEQHCDIDDESECAGYVESCDGPMMNYYYPLPNFSARDVAEFSKNLKDLPVCIVEFTDEEEYGLALTGGGMDLSWEICEAYTRCGYFPPTHFCDLPAMAGRGTSRRDRLIIQACRRSLRGVKARTSRALQSLTHNFKRNAA